MHKLVNDASFLCKRWFLLTPRPAPRSCGGRTDGRPAHSDDPPLRGSAHVVGQRARRRRDHVRLRAGGQQPPSSSCVSSGMAAANWAPLSESAAAHSTTRAGTVPRTGPGDGGPPRRRRTTVRRNSGVVQKFAGNLGAKFAVQEQRKNNEHERGAGAHRAGMDETPACRTPAWAVRPHAARPHGRYARMAPGGLAAERGRRRLPLRGGLVRLACVAGQRSVLPRMPHTRWAERRRIWGRFPPKMGAFSPFFSISGQYNAILVAFRRYQY